MVMSMGLLCGLHQGMGAGWIKESGEEGRGCKHILLMMAMAMQKFCRSSKLQRQTQHVTA
jgi:hypothetical protein